MTTTTHPAAAADLPEALRLTLEALEHSEPTHKHYAEPRERHAQAIAADRAALSAAAPAVAPAVQGVHLFKAYRAKLIEVRNERPNWKHAGLPADDWFQLTAGEQIAFDAAAKLIPAQAAPTAPQAVCTCPSGDGSLRWPCPAHPAPQPPAAPGVQDAAELRAEVDRLNAIINTPQADDFLRAASIEAEHQRQRWPSEHDAGKTPADWFWLIGYLAGKALHAHGAGNAEKAEHHIITTAAACANWHLAVFGKTNMRPGIAAKEQQ